MTTLDDGWEQPKGAKRVIKATKRKDGTLRKEVAVREGFKSEELDAETRAYQSKGSKIKKEIENYIPGAPPGVTLNQPTEDKKKKTSAEKRKKKKEKDQLQKLQTAQEETPVASKAPVSEPAPSPTSASQPAEESAAVKQVRKLKKLLRQIEEIEQLKKGSKPLTPEQSEKLGRKDATIKQIADLEKQEEDDVASKNKKKNNKKEPAATKQETKQEKKQPKEQPKEAEKTEKKQPKQEVKASKKPQEKKYPTEPSGDIKVEVKAKDKMMHYLADSANTFVTANANAPRVKTTHTVYEKSDMSFDFPGLTSEELEEL